MKGMVSLVGAGPGDPGLLTLKAKERLEEADLIVYDYLANPAHLLHARKNAVLAGVGKGFRHKTLSQNKINRLIVSSALRGKKVVRLKGGDPYLFGRGGEEALYLEKNKIPFEVVPGVTSATACAAYSGIPLTHRDHNASVTFLTGHRAGDGHLDSIRWNKIAQIGGTIVIYMGFYNLAEISKQLIKAGMPPKTPIAVIEWGTLPRQKTAVGTLQNIILKIKKEGLAPPCLIIIGDVVTLRKKLGWFEHLPLFGKKIVITRALEKTAGFRDKLLALGAEPIEMPLIQITEPDSFKEMDRAIQQIKKYDWLVFASAYGVGAFFKRLAHHGLDARALQGTRVASVGTQTSAALFSHGIQADLQPAYFQTSEILKMLKKKEKSLKNKNFLLLRADIAPVDFEKDLSRIGARVDKVVAYKTTLPRQIDPVVKKRILSGCADYVAFTSASTVRNFVQLMGKKNMKKIAKKTRFLSIGPVTTKTLKSYGLAPYRQAKTFTVDGLIKTMTVKKNS